MFTDVLKTILFLPAISLAIVMSPKAQAQNPEFPPIPPGGKLVLKNAIEYQKQIIEENAIIEANRVNGREETRLILEDLDSLLDAITYIVEATEGLDVRIPFTDRSGFTQNTYTSIIRGPQIPKDRLEQLKNKTVNPTLKDLQAMNTYLGNIVAFIDAELNSNRKVRRKEAEAYDIRRLQALGIGLGGGLLSLLGLSGVIEFHPSFLDQALVAGTGLSAVLFGYLNWNPPKQADIRQKDLELVSERTLLQGEILAYMDQIVKSMQELAEEIQEQEAALGSAASAASCDALF